MLTRIIRRASDVGRRSSFVIRHSSFVTRHSSSKGFSLVEIMIVLIIMAIALIPMMDSITSSFQSTAVSEENTILVNYGREKIEDILAMDFITVPISSPSGTPIALSDTVVVIGKTMNRDVYVDLYDGNGDSVPDNTLKKIIVQIKDYRVETLMAIF